MPFWSVKNKRKLGGVDGEPLFYSVKDQWGQTRLIID